LETKREWDFDTMNCSHLEAWNLLKMNLAELVRNNSPPNTLIDLERVRNWQVVLDMMKDMEDAN
jgi:hypothetical protein